MAAIDPEAGFVKLPRAIFSEPWAHRPYCLALFVYLLAHANQEPKKWNGIRIERGQLVTSRSRLVEETGISEKCVRKALQELEAAGRANRRASRRANAARLGRASQWANGYTLITICNFDDYNGASVEVVQPKGQPKNEERANQRANQRAITKEDIYIFLFEIEPDSDFRSILKSWIDYKAERGELYKAKSSVKSVRDKLRRESGDNQEIARAMIEKAMACGWQGFYPPDEASARASRGASTPSRHDSRYIDSTDIFKANY